MNGDLDPTYSELDFSEYLPNGGWGEVGPINYQTTWYTYRNEPWFADNVHSEQRSSLDGWHDLVAQVAGGHVKYYIDGTLVGDHSGKYYPRQNMSINFNLWFIDTAGHTVSGTSVYNQQIDWVYYSRSEVVAPADVVSRAAAYRAAGTTHTDTVSGGTGTCPTTPPTATPTATSTTRPPTTPPTTRPPTTPPTTTPPSTPPTTAPPANCGAAPAWNWGTVYLEGSRVKHVNHLWQANWWTLGSEPGLTAQWRDLGRC